MTSLSHRQVLIFLLWGTSLQAKEPGAAFLSLPTSVRSESLGGTGSLALGAESLGINPAMLAPIKSEGQMYTSFAPIWDDTWQAHLAVARGLGPRRWGVGLAVTTVQTEDKTGRDSSGARTPSTPGAQDSSVMIGTAFRPSLPWRVGASARVFRSEVGGYTSNTAWAIDGGLAYAQQSVLLSLAINNIGPGQKFQSQTDPLPTLVRADVAVSRGSLTWVGGAQRDVPRQLSRVATGVEYRWLGVALRGGYNLRVGGHKDRADHRTSMEKSLDGLRFGFGATVWDSLRLDYAFVPPTAADGGMHRAGLMWAWGPAPQPPVFPKQSPKVPRTRKGNNTVRPKLSDHQ